MTTIVRAIPVLRVADVGRSVEWYRRVLGFEADGSPGEPRHAFAMITRDGAELMLQGVAPGEEAGPVSADTWSVYLRLSGEGLLQLCDQVKLHTPVLAGPWRKFYCDAEFEIADPDGHRLCLGELLPDSVELPSPLK
jgi:catechol 2,3-dioxygenase-like lactoylglutathione lyase family enzyme